MESLSLMSSSVVGLSLQPVSGRKASEEKLPGLVVAEDEDGEWEGGKPPGEVEGEHPQTFVHPGAVAEEHGQASLEHQAKVEKHVGHSLLEDGVLPGLADDQVRPLHDHDGHEEGCVASVLQDLSVPVGQIVML